MIEAEGTLLPRSTHGMGISVGNTDVEIISTLLRFVGDGRVKLHTPTPQAWGKKLVWFWELTHVAGVTALAPQVVPWMTVKGEKLRAMTA